MEKELQNRLITELKPTEEGLNSALQKWKESKTTIKKEYILCNLFLYDNRSEDIVKLKVETLNLYYSTRILAVGVVSRHIVDVFAHKDEKMLTVDYNSQDEKVFDLVDEIAKVTFNLSDNSVAVRNMFSFATKYCSFHNPDAFYIYDRNVVAVLKLFKNDFGGKFSEKELRSYKCFRQIMEQFRNYYGFDKYSCKELDIYLWQLGDKILNPESPGVVKN